MPTDETGKIREHRYSAKAFQTWREVDPTGCEQAHILYKLYKRFKTEKLEQSYFFCLFGSEECSEVKPEVGSLYFQFPLSEIILSNKIRFIKSL